MAIAQRLQDYLKANTVPYDEIEHPRAVSASRAAQAARVPGERVAKTVVLHDAEGYLVAVVPSTHRVELDTLQGQLGRRLNLATEAEIAALFNDCDVGAAPAIGAAYGVNVMCDESLATQPEIYFDAGNHMELVRVDRSAFETLMQGAAWGRFSHRE